MSSAKPWDRPWSMEEIIDNSDKWSLAGDVALLNTLKSFADNFISKTTEINNNLHNLTNTLEETSLQLNIAQNEFQSLRNSQFIESRVYEDDETLPAVENNDKVEEKVKPDHTEDIKAAALKGLEALDRYFDKIEVSVSDSEDDDIDLPNYVLRPKDLYIDRPLPYVIGSEEWHKSWHVGLEESSSDSETEKVSDKFSESDSESDLAMIRDRSQIKGTSDTSSELDFSQKTESGKPKQDLFQSSDSEDQASVEVSVSNKNFAEELAAKLGNVIKQEGEEPEVNRRPIQTKTNYGDLFFDEPPPLDNNKGLFSGGTGLFDDDDDEYSTPIESKVESPKISKKTGLFDDDDDGDIFNSKKPVLQSDKPPLFTEEPPALVEKKKPVGGVSIFGGKDLFDRKLLKRQPDSDDEENKEISRENTKKIDLFSDGDLFKTVPEEKKSINKSEIPTKKINLFDESDDDDKNTKTSLFGDDKKNTKLFEDTSQDQVKEVKKISLFDDDDLFKDDLFSTTTKKKFASSLFDDIDTRDDLFSEKSEDKPKPAKNLFEDLMSIPDNKNSINGDDKIETKEQKVEVNSTKSPIDSLFESAPTTTDSLFSDLDNSKSIAQKPEVPKPLPRMSLFDSPPPETDDLFGSEYSPVKEEPPKIVDNEEISQIKVKTPSSSLFDSSLSDDLFGGAPEKPTPATKILPNMRLFDPSPPPDDEWEAKSENISEDNDSSTDQEEVAGLKTSLFNDEPPSLDLHKEKPVASSPGKLKHNLNINVGALMPGSRPPKRVTIEKALSEDSTEDERSFDATDNVEVLRSVTKDRVRVPLNRRPSTRRGRKAALENASSDFKLEQEANTSPPQRDDLLDVKPTPPPQNPDSIFESSTDDLFEVKPPKLTPKPDLFDDDDDDDDMFSNKKVPVQPTKISKKSLFDDDDNDDDDDIFRSFATTSTVKKQETKIAGEKKIPKVSSVKKLENTKPDDDPLSALLK